MFSCVSGEQIEVFTVYPDKRLSFLSDKKSLKLLFSLFVFCFFLKKIETLYKIMIKFKFHL